MDYVGTGPCRAFGTIASGGQNREHERLTRAALACAGDGGSDIACFEPTTMAYLAGHDREFGAVGSPDSDELSDPAAHCDNADYLATVERPTRDQASAQLIACVNHLRNRFREGAERAAYLLDNQGRIVQDEVGLESECKTPEHAQRRAKCGSIEGLGRALHGVQDFYAHSNWADDAEPTRPIGDDNPPGLNLPGPSPVLDLRSATTPRVPLNLTTGCYVLKDEVPGVAECERRVTHAALNKDRGLIDPDTGKATGPTTPRGMVGDNFAKAVSGAVRETRRQWQDFQSELTARYGQERAELMTCALTHDAPVRDCQPTGWGRSVGTLVVACALAVVITTVLLARRRRRRS